MLNYVRLVVSSFAVNCRIIFDASTNRCVICDPGDNGNRIWQYIANEQLKTQAIILTHGHLDHCGDARYLADKLSVPIIGPQIDDSYWLENLEMQSRMFGLQPREALTVDQFVQDGQMLDLGLSEPAQVLHCPGHTPGHVCYYFAQSKFVLSGDVLFAGSVGRSDFPQGDHSSLIKGIITKLLTLPPETAVLPGHGPDTTVEDEAKYNPYLARSNI